MPREVTYTANRCGRVSRICSVALAYASDHVTTRNPFSPLRRIIGSGRRPRALKSRELIPESDDTSLRRSGSSAEAVFKRISSRRTMQRWTPSWVQSLRPTVPSAHPSQTPCCRIRQAKGSWSRFSQRTRSISAYWFGLCSVGSRGITEAQSDGFQPMLHAPALCGLNRSRSDLTPIVAVCHRRIAHKSPTARYIESCDARAWSGFRAADHCRSRYGSSDLQFFNLGVQHTVGSGRAQLSHEENWCLEIFSTAPDSGKGCCHPFVNLLFRRRLRLALRGPPMAK